MFDVSFVELMLIGVIALLVLGPEKLPGAARTVGNFVRRARNSWNSVRSEFEREIAADELKRSMRDTAREFEQATQELDPRAELARAEQEARDATQRLIEPLTEVAGEGSAAVREALADTPAVPAPTETPPVGALTPAAGPDAPEPAAEIAAEQRHG